METRTYQAPTMAKALVAVKHDLGPAAVILHTRRLRKGRMLGLFGGRTTWEIQAAPNVNVLPQPIKSQYVPTDQPPEASPHDADVADSAPQNAAEAGENHPSSDRAGLAGKMSEIHQMVATLLSGRPSDDGEHMPPEMAALRRRLLDQDVERSIAVQLLRELQGGFGQQDLPAEQVLRDRLTEMIARRIQVGPIRPAATKAGPCRLIALVGPTGVGKTTTIAKLAANYKIREHKKVGLITIDTYRIAAVEQLRTYAEIIQVPIEAVLTPGELHQAIQAMSGLDIVLIDTAGRSQNNEMRLKELRRFTEVAGCDEVYLVASAAGSSRVAAAALDRFALLGANGIIVTKLDEAATFGMILNMAAASGAGIGYVTTGQDVPDDIAPANADLLARCIMKGSWDAS